MRVTLTIEGGALKPIKAQRTVNLVQKGQTATADFARHGAAAGVP